MKTQMNRVSFFWPCLFLFASLALSGEASAQYCTAKGKVTSIDYDAPYLVIGVTVYATGRAKGDRFVGYSVFGRYHGEIGGGGMIVPSEGTIYGIQNVVVPEGDDSVQDEIRVLANDFVSNPRITQVMTTMCGFN